MALRASNFTAISTQKEWVKFFLDELSLSPDIAEGYAEELTSQNITGSNIIVGLAEPGFLNQFNMSVGHQLELKTRFRSVESTPTTHTPKNKVPTPVVRMDISQVEFDQFRFEWDRYKEHYNITTNAATSLFFCCSEEVRTQIRIVQCTEHLSWTEETLMDAIKQTVLSKVSSIVHIKQFMELKQEGNESVQKFLQKLQAKASCCKFSCRSCNKSTSEERVREKFILGLKDNTIQRSALKTESITPNTPLSKLLAEALTLEQSTKDQQSISTTSAVESGVFEASMNSDEVNAIKVRKSTRTGCTHCGKNDHSSQERQEKCPAWGKKCNNCGILNHFQSSCLKPKRKARPGNAKVVQFAEILFIGEISSIQLPVKVEPYDSGSPATIEVFPDTGANICLMGPSQLSQLKMKLSSLDPCQHPIGVAGGTTITATGTTMMKISLDAQSTETLVYFSKSAKRFFLSRQCCQDLNIIPESFPYPPTLKPDTSLRPSTQDSSPRPSTVKQVTASHPPSIKPDTALRPSTQNSSPRPPTVKKGTAAGVQNNRTIPQRPKCIPFEPTEENIPALKYFILVQFEKSAFNSEKPFPALSTPPAHIHLKLHHIIPKPAYWPATIAEHWAKIVKAAIDRDVEAGILIKVPFNEPTTWCARMVVVKKKDGSPRRTVDYQELNKQCIREPNHGESPFHTARRVPENTWKSVFDAVDGYHSVILDEESSKLTTFITPWGRYRYLRFPQGHCSAGDAFNGRVQEILSNIPRMVRIVDDMCIYDSTIEGAFWHAWDLLTTCAQHGIVINKSKFQFCATTVDFAGLTITVDGVRPSTKILQAIRDFPPPTDIGKARSFFGLLNQVQWAYANSDKMSPFRDLVKPNSLFRWTPQLKQLFQEAKDKILHQVDIGVRHYDVNRATCLQTDFCKNGIGYLLLQKFCSCSLENAPLCCTDGWKLVFAGSRFTKGAEMRYAPTEGEALAVSWALNHAHIFTKGCPNLIVSTDHKPLLGIFNDKPMETIKNPRILRLKEHTLHFDFSMKYNKGKWHRAADALSRNPCSSFVEMLCAFPVEHKTDGLDDNYSNMAIFAIEELDSNLEKVRDHTATDRDLILLKSAILNGFPGTQHATDPSIRSYFNVREHLWIDDNDIIMFKDRIVVPKILRQQILRSLHSAHQGTKGMQARASTCVYWPGINSSIEQTRRSCGFCDSISPSLPRQPLQALPQSTYPFEYICADAFEMHGHPYLVVVDKFSGWPILFHFRTSIASRNIIDSLKQVFSTYGTPKKLYSDGALVFTSAETKEFLQRWGVEHMISSAEYPQSNGRAELGVKTSRRILDQNVSKSNGSLYTEAVTRALLQYRNTPIQGLGLSPAQILFHRNLRDTVPVRSAMLKPHQQWIVAAENRELAFQKRNADTNERYNTFTRDLSPLPVGTRVLIQDHAQKRRWNRSGVIVERLDRKYTIRMDGSGRIVSRNRKFLKVARGVAHENDWDPSDHGTTSAGHETHDTQDSISEDIPTGDQADQTHDSNATNGTPRGQSQANENNIESTPERVRPASPIPAMVRRLLPYNKPGIKE